MWSIMNSMGNPAHSGGPFKSQKREFSLTVGKVPIVPGKTFSNPNFVIKHHPSVHSHKDGFVPTQIERINRSDSSNCKPLNTNSALINSSQSLVDTLKEHHLDTIKSPEPNPQVETPNTQPSRMCNKKNSRGNRRTRRRKASGKNSNQNDTKNYMKDMMDMEIDMDTSFSYTDISVSPKTPGNTFCLTDFIVEKPRKVHKAATEVENDYDSDGEEFVATIISVSPPAIDKTCMRERQVSMSESEDSFIVFNDGTDEELESSEESDSETEEEWDDEEGEDEVDFVFSAIPVKKVRFAEEGDLCHVYNMVEWSDEYHQARKGPWEEYARDRDRFNRKAAEIEKILMPVFDPAHRSQVYAERFTDTTVN